LARRVTPKWKGHLKSRPRGQKYLRLLVNRVCDENPMHREHQGYSFEGPPLSDGGVIRIEPFQVGRADGACGEHALTARSPDLPAGNLVQLDAK
jgi:hypothetical protein